MCEIFYSVLHKHTHSQLLGLITILCHPFESLLISEKPAVYFLIKMQGIITDIICVPSWSLLPYYHSEVSTHPLQLGHWHFWYSPTCYHDKGFRGISWHLLLKANVLLNHVCFLLLVTARHQRSVLKQRKAKREMRHSVSLILWYWYFLLILMILHMLKWSCKNKFDNQLVQQVNQPLCHFELWRPEGLAGQQHKENLLVTVAVHRDVHRQTFIQTQAPEGKEM